MSQLSCWLILILSPRSAAAKTQHRAVVDKHLVVCLWTRCQTFCVGLRETTRVYVKSYMCSLPHGVHSMCGHVEPNGICWTSHTQPITGHCQTEQTAYWHSWSGLTEHVHGSAALNLLFTNKHAQIVSHVSLRQRLLCNNSSMAGQRWKDYLMIGTAVLMQFLSGSYIIIVPVCIMCRQSLSAVKCLETSRYNPVP